MQTLLSQCEGNNPVCERDFPAWICSNRYANRTLTLQPRKRELLLIYPYGAT
jgi:hypothetical protein